MVSLFGQVMLQALYYGIIMVLTLFFCGAFQRGFFVNYFKVRTSFGKYVMVKCRSPLRDYFRKGWVEEGFLVYQNKKGFMDKDTIRLNIPENSRAFYRCLNVVWIDVDTERHAICQTDYTTVSGYDAVKNNNLHTRALMRPTISSNQEKILMLLIIVVGILAIIGIYFGYSSLKSINLLNADLPNLLKGLHGTVVGGQTV
jgi:hypothetical protein